MTTIEEIEKNVNTVLALFDTEAGKQTLGENVTQKSHMIQCAMNAERDGQPPDVIIGALLHDIGNLVAHGKGDVERVVVDNTDIGPKDHDALGEQFLKQHGFPLEIYCFARGHVDATRYMAWKHKDYKSTLTWPSQKSLERRGGAFSDAEAAAFEKLPHYQAIVKCRAWDELANVPNAPLDSLDKFKTIAMQYLTMKAFE